ncbi:aldehyde dehydrogenase family protein [Sediminicurvatus halobius]|uniref:aldehyde dehydrogenase (NAD(+)) n=1 Tax=Sediminicurvatus halobius TaxID=2182432 RepID=A0A2U2MYH1_9GAMM|nr:aldehyde dehydrogenase family protein [Spiribacter halobius]PWG61842.1 aldehyde dehydrogenase family protein [Spiribacter halobius]UEX77684.1 aldehyde dehydrogenase family protein [Spiribacter halobius]
MQAVPVHTHYVAGHWQRPNETATIVVRNPTTEAVVGEVSLATAEQVAAACQAAATALPEWSAISASARAGWLRAIAEALAARREQIAHAITCEVGMPLKMARRLQAGLPVETFRATADAIESLDWETKVGHSTVRRVPTGVVGAITPWNMPLHQIAAKVAPAIGTGCTVVLKPSELTPSVATLLGEVLDEVELPPGVCNIVHGTGPEAGAALVRDPRVRFVSFTGSTEAGRDVASAAAVRLKRVALELGGKSAAVVLDDANLASAVRTTLGAGLLNSGQMCNAISRLIVPRERLEETLELAASELERFTMGDPFDDATRLGPVISAEQRDRVRRTIDRAVERGARHFTTTQPLPETGHFVAPTLLAPSDPDDSVAQEEIFGPVICVLSADDDEHAVDLANGTRYGLAASVWSADPQRAERVAESLVAGQVEINGARFNPHAPFGGFRDSGYGRELGAYGVDEFLELKATQHPD